MRRALRLLTWRTLNVASICAQLPRLPVVRETYVEQSAQTWVKRLVFHRRYSLDATIEVARHPVRGADEVGALGVVREVEEPRMFEKPADDADDANAIAHVRNAGAEAADAAHDQIDLDTRLRRLVECLDEPRPE